MDLSTHYIGLTLKNPLVPSASPISRDLDQAKRMEDAGASALVMYSLFEEEIIAEQEQWTGLLDFQDLGHGEASSYLPVHPNYQSGLDEYLNQLQALKNHLDIPIIASLNGATESGWIEHGLELEKAGADALELNIYFLPDMNQSAVEVESRYIHLLKQLKQTVNIPVTVKLSPYFTSLAHFVHQLEQAGADGVVLFNRFYQPDLDLDSLTIQPRLHYSHPYESLLRMHWIGRLYSRVQLDMAATGGVHELEQVIKLSLVGAKVTHLCSALLQNGPELIGQLINGLAQWLEENEYQSLAQMQGSVCQNYSMDPSAWDRVNYVKTLTQ